MEATSAISGFDSALLFFEGVRNEKKIEREENFIDLIYSTRDIYSLEDIREVELYVAESITKKYYK